MKEGKKTKEKHYHNRVVNGKLNSCKRGREIEEILEKRNPDKETFAIVNLIAFNHEFAHSKWEIINAILWKLT